MSRMANDSKFRNKLEERLGTERYEELARTGHQDKLKGDRMSAAEVIAKFRERPKGVTVDEGNNSMRDKFQNYVNNDMRFNNKAREYLIAQGVDFSDKERKKKAPAPVRDSSSDGIGDIVGTITDSDRSHIGHNINSGTINADSGSIVNNPVGDNNYISTNVDNSRRELADFAFDPNDFLKSSMAKLLAS